jgi:hypothetical protein
MYDPHRDLYVVLGVSAGAVRDEIRGAITRRYATVPAQDLAEACRLLLSPSLRWRYDFQRAVFRMRGLLTRLRSKIVRGRSPPQRGWWKSTPPSWMPHTRKLHRR